MASPKAASFTLAVLMAISVCGGCQPLPVDQSIQTIDGTRAAFDEIERVVPRIMEKFGVAGLSCAVLNDSQLVYAKTFGYKDRQAGTLAGEDTIFGGASFSKPVFGYIVARLAADGVIDLDTPLHEVLAKPLGEYPKYVDLAADERHRAITARTVLSHSTGLPNWRFHNPSGRLELMFDPGERFSYSGEGIFLLQTVVEEVTGKGLEELARELVFEPFGMTRSSYEWQPGYEEDFARPHDRYVQSRKKARRGRADAAGSLQTTASDYARFLAGLLASQTSEEMLRTQVAIDSANMFGPGAWQRIDGADERGLSWCLGWGCFESPRGRAFFHTGHDFGFQNYVVMYPDVGVGVVMLANSDNFESIAPRIAEKIIGDEHSPFDWLGYPPPSRPEPPPPARVAVDVDPAILASYAGEYELMPGETIRVKYEDGQLLISSLDQPWEELLAESETRVFARDVAGTFRFEVDADRRVTALRLGFEEFELPAPARKVESADPLAASRDESSA